MATSVAEVDRTDAERLGFPLIALACRKPVGSREGQSCPRRSCFTCSSRRSVTGRSATLRIAALIVDSQDPGRLARFWAEALDWVISQDQDPEWVIEPPEGSREDCVVADLLFIKVPEPKTSKNRLHLDLRPEHQFSEVARLEGLGATRVDVGQGNNQTWVVMADPEGNEFCVQDAHPPQVRAQWLQRYEAYQPVRTGT